MIYRAGTKAPPGFFFEEQGVGIVAITSGETDLT
jgi:hypothetical protein